MMTTTPNRTHRRSLLRALAPTLLLALLSLGVAGVASADECRPDCREEKRACRAAIKEAAAACREACAADDKACRLDCRVERIEAKAACRAERLSCKLGDRENLDPMCAESCIDESLACFEEGVGCRKDCAVELKDAIQACREQAEADDSFDGRACVKEAKEDLGECVALCREDSCKGDLRPCLSECVIEEPGDDQPEI